jgi:7,8-dihydropterin-6-yl-methyl-4-(beta-D-ribofuranosyl)aminobenzene 5'-phosphate synthase
MTMALPPATITILVDNQAGPDLATEHGLALWIETRDGPLLFDTGQGAALPGNARALGIDLRRTAHLVLSHGHYDHTGGVPHVLMAAPGVHVHCHPGVVQPRYRRREESPKAIQMPRGAMAALDRLPENQLHWISEATFLTEAIGLTGPIPRQTTFEDTGGPFYQDPETRRPDPINDDQALWIRTDQGLVICVGCCHAGLINTLNHIRRLSGVQTIRAVIGGLHLINADRRRLDETVAALQRLAVENVIPCHCTGERAVSVLKTALDAEVQAGISGAVYRF